jgi:hypothetical protein
MWNGKKDFKDDLQNLYVCDCSDISHVMRVSVDEDEKNIEIPSCYVEFGMRAQDEKGFFSRLWEGLKYIYSGNYMFTELVFTRRQMEEMRDNLTASLKRKRIVRPWEKKKKK